MALGVGGSIYGGQCATRFGVQVPADLAGRVSLGQISNYAAVQNLVAIQQALLSARLGRAGVLAGLLGRLFPVRTRMADDLMVHHRRATPSQVSDVRLG